MMWKSPGKPNKDVIGRKTFLASINSCSRGSTSEEFLISQYQLTPDYNHMRNCREANS